METINNQAFQPEIQFGSMDYAAALRQYNKYDCSRSIKKFYKDEGLRNQDLTGFLPCCCGDNEPKSLPRSN